MIQTYWGLANINWFYIYNIIKITILKDYAGNYVISSIIYTSAFYGISIILLLKYKQKKYK